MSLFKDVVALLRSHNTPFALIGAAAMAVHGVSRSTRDLEAEIEGISVPVADRADLILLKLYASGPQDAWDIAQLLALETRATIIDEVGSRLHDLPAECQGLWQRIRSG